ncbi:hypothetical protein C84B14_08617 [Salinisphaera sp. C84B14]|uniref:hypothetical protein n=1 Tax=Salinisphaera sp. C84B14 TaxID=1304155 RepID=UPI00334226F3
MKNADSHVSFLNAQAVFWGWLGGLFGPLFISFGISEGFGSPHLWLGTVGTGINVLALREGMRAKREQRTSDFVVYGLVSAFVLLVGVAVAVLDVAATSQSAAG